VEYPARVTLTPGWDRFNTRTLRFLDPALETAFTDDQTPAFRNGLRLACLLNAPLWGIGGLIAPPTIGVDPAPIWTACSIMVGLLLGTAWFAQRAQSRRELEIAGLLINFASGVVIVVLGSVTGLFDRFAGMLIIFSAIVAMIVQRLTFPTSLAFAAGQFTIFSIAAVLVGSAPVFQIFLVGSMLAITMFGVYVVEWKERRVFAQGRLIDELHRQVDRLFHRYLSPHVADALLDDPDRAELGGEVVEATVLFADLTGFTPYAEGRNPAAVVEMLNEVYGAAVPAVFAEGGTIIQFVGDALMAVFNAPVRQPDHALRAARAARALQAAVADLELAADAPRFRVGISSGPVLVGNVGSEDIRNFLAIGDTTNLAARIQTFARPGQIILSEHTHALVADHVDVRPLGTPELKGKSSAIALLELVAIRDV
jgi:class 3 adenylate cyclase